MVGKSGAEAGSISSFICGVGCPVEDDSFHMPTLVPLPIVIVFISRGARLLIAANDGDS